ncbi:MFS transporter [Sanguibacter sp. A247]|uniref:MFS transporter n=1 Tax=unclassified Sanguibacter TaxID=2645534 RepID=UPI003FD8FB34
MPHHGQADLSGHAPTQRNTIDHVTPRALVVWGVALLAYVLAVAARSSLSATGVEAAERFATTSATLSSFAVLQLVVYAGLQVPVGLFLDRFGPRMSLTVGCALIGAGQIFLGLADSVPAAVAARVLVGSGDAFVFIPAVRLLPAWFPARTVPVATQVTGLVGQLGQLLSLGPFVALVAVRGWTGAFTAAGVVTLLAAVLVVLVVRDARRVSVEVDLTSLPDAHAAPAAPPARAAVVIPTPDAPSLRRTLLDPGTRAGFWLHFVAAMPAYAFVLLWGFPYMTRAEGLSDESALQVLSVYVGAFIVFSPVMGLLSGRFASRRLMLVLGGVGLQVAAWTVTLTWPGHTPTTLLLALVIVMGVAGPASLLGLDQARATVPLRSQGVATGMVNAGAFLANLLAMGIIGIVLDLAGETNPALFTDRGFTWAWLALTPILVVGIVMAVFEDRRLRRHLASTVAA